MNIKLVEDVRVGEEIYGHTIVSLYDNVVADIVFVFFDANGRPCKITLPRDAEVLVDGHKAQTDALVRNILSLNENT